MNNEHSKAYGYELSKLNGVNWEFTFSRLLGLSVLGMGRYEILKVW